MLTLYLTRLAFGKHLGSIGVAVIQSRDRRDVRTAGYDAKGGSLRNFSLPLQV